MSETRLHQALEFAERIHETDRKAGTQIPFIFHPMAVAALVLRHGGSPTQAIAALLHDTICGGRVTERELTEKFGPTVARLVFAFADPEPPPAATPSWQDSKRAYLEKLSGLDAEALFVIACEELHDGSELLEDLRYEGAQAWKRRGAHGMELFWYYRELLQIFHRTLGRTPGGSAGHRSLVGEFGRMVAAFKAITIEGASY